MNILTWLCSISVCFLCMQIFEYMCKDAFHTFNEIKKSTKNINKKRVSPEAREGYRYRQSSNYEEKIAK